MVRRLGVYGGLAGMSQGGDLLCLLRVRHRQNRHGVPEAGRAKDLLPRKTRKEEMAAKNISRRAAEHSEDIFSALLRLCAKKEFCRVEVIHV